MRARNWNLFLLGLAAVFYVTNKLALQSAAQGWLRWFLVCYANDIWAGLAILAWVNLLLDLGRLPPLRSWWLSALLLLGCGLVWEVLAPLWKPGAVCDPWDMLAYLAGGAVYRLIASIRNRKPEI